MNKTTGITAALLLILIISIPIGYSNSRVEVTLKDLSPSIVRPGEDFALKIDIENLNDDSVKINNISLDLKNKFILMSSSGNNIDTICSHCYKTITYYIKANSGLKSGLYPIEINIKYNSNYNKKEDFFVKVVGKPKLIIQPIIIGEVFPGSVFNISFTLSNVGTNDAKNIQIISNSDEIGFLNKNSLYISNISQGASFKIKGNIVSSDNLKNGYLQIPFTISYEDYENNKYTDKINVGVYIKNKAHIVIQNLKTYDDIKLGKEFEVDLRIENDGVGTAKDVTATVSGDFKGSNVGYFGSIDRNEDLPHIYKLIPTKSGDAILKIKIKYKDDYGEHYLEENYHIYVSNSIEWKYLALLGALVSLLLVILFLAIKKRGN